MKTVIWYIVVFVAGFAIAGCGTLTGMVDDAEDIIVHARTHVK